MELTKRLKMYCNNQYVMHKMHDLYMPSKNYIYECKINKNCIICKRYYNRIIDNESEIIYISNYIPEMLHPYILYSKMIPKKIKLL